jgi:DNA-binding transcriptional LysR family regulator
VDEGSFAGAARKLKSSRSRISEQVSQLEKDLQIRLLQRSTRQLGMTQEGLKIYQKAKKLPDMLSEIESITKSDNSPSGKVTLTLSQDSAHKLFLPTLKVFQEKYPEIELDLLLEDRQMDLIKNQIDLAIRIGSVNDESLIARELHREAIGFFASPDYLKIHGCPEDLDDLKNHSWITYKDDEPFIKVVKQEANVTIKPKKIIRCNSPMMAHTLAANGFGLSLFFPCTIQPELSSHQLVQVMPHWQYGPFSFYLVYLSRHHIPERVRVLIDFILSAEIFAKAKLHGAA